MDPHKLVKCAAKEDLTVTGADAGGCQQWAELDGDNAGFCGKGKKDGSLVGPCYESVLEHTKPVRIAAYQQTLKETAEKADAAIESGDANEHDRQVTNARKSREAFLRDQTRNMSK